jgi:hypothetical protein
LGSAEQGITPIFFTEPVTFIMDGKPVTKDQEYVRILIAGDAGRFLAQMGQACRHLDWQDAMGSTMISIV